MSAWPDNQSSRALELASTRAPRWSGWLYLLIALVATAVYANSLRNGFAFDDVGVVRDNPHVAHLDWLGIWHDNYWPDHDGIKPDILYRPLTLWSYLANQAIAPGVEWTFHLVNVLLHAAASVLVAVLAWRLLGDRIVATVAGLIFAVHPLHTEAVANVVGRAELLAALWSLLTLLVFLPAEPLAGPASLANGVDRRFASRGWWHGLLVAACFLAAMLSKETPATLPGVLILLDIFRWAQAPRIARPRFFTWMFGQTLRYYVPLAVVFAIYLALRLWGPGLFADIIYVHPLVNLLAKATLAERIVTPFLLFAKYLALAVWPVHLAADYSAPSIAPTSNPLAPGALAGILLFTLAVIIGVRTWRKQPHIALLIGMFFLSYFLISNAIRIGTIFGERLFYWPSVFFLIMIAWGAAALCRGIPGFFGEIRLRKPAWVGASVVLVAVVGLMGWRTAVRNTDWADNITLAIATGRDNPNSAKSCLWAGSMLVVAENPGYPEIGRDLLERAAELYPNVSDTYWELAKYYGRKEDLGHSLIYVARVAQMEPGSHNVHLAIQGLLADLKRNAPESYMPFLEKYAREHATLAESHFALAVAYHAQGKWEEASESAGKALVYGEHAQFETGSHFYEAGAELAAILFDQGKIQEAVTMYRPFVIFVHRSVDARCTMARMLMSLDPSDHPKALDEAAMNLERAAQVDPADPELRKARFELLNTRRLVAQGKTPPRMLPWLASPEDGRPEVDR